MAIVQIANFGENEEGVYMFRVNGDKPDLEKIIEEAVEMGWSFWEEPIIEKVFRHYSVLIRIYKPQKEIGENS